MSTGKYRRSYRASLALITSIGLSLGFVAVAPAAHAAANFLCVGSNLAPVIASHCREAQHSYRVTNAEADALMNSRGQAALCANERTAEIRTVEAHTRCRSTERRVKLHNRPSAKSAPMSSRVLAVPGEFSRVWVETTRTAATVRGIGIDNGGSPLTGYEYRIGDMNLAHWGPWVAVPAQDIVLRGLATCVTYSIQVRGVNELGPGMINQPMTFALATDQQCPVSPSGAAAMALLPRAPGQISDVEVTSTVTPTAAPTSFATHVSFSAPLAGTTGTTDIQYQLSSDDGQSFGTWISAGGVDSPITLTELAESTAYIVRLRAANSVGAGVASTGIAFTTPALLPARPSITGIQRQDSIFAGYQGASFSVNLPDNGTAPVDRIEFELAGSTGTSYQGFTQASTTAYDHCNTTLTQCTSLQLQSGFAGPQKVRVHSHNAAGWSPWSVAFDVAGLPSAPSIAPLNTSTTTADLLLTAGADNGSAVTSYDYRLSIDGGQSWGSTVSISSTSQTLTGLMPDTEYTVQARAVNGQGAGTWSSPRSFTTAGVPGAPTITGQTPVMSGASMSFSAPSQDGQSTISGYVYQYTSDGGITWTQRASIGTSSPVTIPLPDATIVSIRLAAVNANGTGPWSSEYQIGSTTPAAQVPTGLALTFNAAGSPSISAHWDPAATAASYEVRISQTSLGATLPGDWSPAEATSSTSFSISALSLGHKYWVQARSVNALGASQWSAPVGTDAATAPAQPTVTGVSVSGSPWGSSYSGITLTSSISSNGGSPLTSAYWHVTYANGTGADYNFTGNTANFYCNGAYTSCHNDFASPSVQTGHRKVRVYVTNAYGKSSWSAWFDLPWVPNSPAVTSVTLDGTTANMAFTAPADNGGLPILGYAYQTSVNSGATWSSAVSVSSTTSPIAISGLAPGGAYQVRLAAVNSQGTGNYSSPTTFMVGTAPGPVDALHLVSAVNGGLEYAFTMAPTGGAPIIRYEYRVTTSGSAFGSSWSSIGGNTSFMISGLLPGVSYDVEVRAVNAIGSGPSASATDTAGVQPAVPSAAASQQPDGSFVVSFTPGASAAMLGQLTYGLVLPDGSTLWATAGSTSLTVTRAALGTATMASPLARSSAGLLSDPGMAVMLGATAAAPDSPSVTASYMDGAIYWTVTPGSQDGGVDLDSYEISVTTDAGTMTIPLMGTTWSGMAAYNSDKPAVVRARVRNGAQLWSGWSTGSSVTPPSSMTADVTAQMTGSDGQMPLVTSAMMMAALPDTVMSEGTPGVAVVGPPVPTLPDVMMMAPVYATTDRMGM